MMNDHNPRSLQQQQRQQVIQIPELIAYDECEDLLSSNQVVEALRGGCALFAGDYGIVNYTRLVYSENPYVSGMHGMPRYGASREIANYVNGNDAQRAAYLRGLKAWAIVLWVSFALWAVWLVVYHRAYKRHKGWFYRWYMWCTTKIQDWNRRRQEQKRLAAALEEDSPAEIEDPAARSSNGRNMEQDSSAMAVTGSVAQQQQDTTSSIMVVEEDSNRPPLIADGALEKAPGDDETLPISEEKALQRDSKTPSNSEEEEVDPLHEHQDPVSLSASKVNKHDEAHSSLHGQDLIYYRQEQRYLDKRRLAASRKCFLSASIFAIVSSILLIALGFADLQRTIKSLEVDLPDLEDLLLDITNVTSVYMVHSDAYREARFETIEALSDNCDFEDIWEELQGQGVTVDNVNEFFNTTDAVNWTGPLILSWINATLNNASTPNNEIRAFHEDMVDLTGTVDSLDSMLRSIDSWWYYPVSAIVVLMDVFIIYWCFQMARHWKAGTPFLLPPPRRRCDPDDYILFPTFAILFFIMFMVSTVCLVVSEVTSDFCIVTPNQQLLDILRPSRLTLPIVVWYLEGCLTQDRPSTLADAFYVLYEALRGVDEVLYVLANASDSWDLPGICNQTTFLIRDLLHLMADRLDAMLDLAAGLVPVLNCERVNQLYSHMSYESVCNHAFQASFQIFGYLTIYTICCMCITSVRISWRDDHGEEFWEPEEIEAVYRGLHRAGDSPASSTGLSQPDESQSKLMKSTES